MDATTLLITVYCLIDEWLAGRRLRQRGPKPILADSEVLAELADRHGELLLPAIPRRVVVADAALVGEPITIYAPYSEAAEAFAALAKEVRRRAETL